MLAFGVIVKATSQPKRHGDVTFLNMIKIVDMSYWQTYGELFLEDLQDDAAEKPGEGIKFFLYFLNLLSRSKSRCFEAFLIKYFFLARLKFLIPRFVSVFIVFPDCTLDYYDDSGLPPCPFLPHASIVYTAVYMVVGNILLMNLLIAIFRLTTNFRMKKSVFHS